MKKISSFALSLLMIVLASSCKNEEIQVDRVQAKFSVTYSVNTQNIYDVFEQTSWLRENRLRDALNKIGIFTYVYDSNGSLVDSKTTILGNFNTAQQSFEKLSKGDYTFVTIETMVDPKTEMPECWSFDDSEKLSTLKITQTERAKRWSIIGQSAQVLSLSGNMSVTVTPNPIGSIVNFYCLNFENSEYVNLGFGTKDVLKYYSLDPKLERKDRFSSNLTSSDKFNLRGALSVAESTHSFLPIYLLESTIEWMNGVQDESRVNTGNWLNAKGRTAELADGQIYTTGFFYLNDGNTGSYFGDVAGYEDWKQKCEKYNIDLASSTIYMEPYLTWGGTVASVKSYMSAYNAGNDGKLVTNEDGTYTMWYYGKYKELETDYYFTTETGGLTNAILFFDSESIGEDDLLKVFGEFGYTFLVSEDGAYLYATKDELSYVYLGLNNQKHWVVNYFSSKTSTRSSGLIQNLKKIVPKSGLNKSTVNRGLDKFTLFRAMQDTERLFISK